MTVDFIDLMGIWYANSLKFPQPNKNPGIPQTLCKNEFFLFYRPLQNQNVKTELQIFPKSFYK